MPTDRILLSNYIQANKILCFALIAGQIFFALVAIFLVNFAGIDINDAELNEVFIFIVPTLGIASLLGSIIVFKGKLSRIKEISDISAKLTEYRSAQIIRWALYEGPSFFAIVVYILTGEVYYLGMVILALILFGMTFPSQERLVKDLDLSWEDQNRLGE